MKYLALISFLAFGLAGCEVVPPAEFETKGNVLEVRGAITPRFVDDLEVQLAQNPDIDTLRLSNIPGSLDDSATLLRLTELVRSNQLSTIVPAEGLVASGGTDMALMGVTRTIEPGACIGVHTWGAAGNETGATLPKDSEEHQLYFDFYEIVNIPIDFYWFTLDAAGPDDIYWMSADEINRFGMVTTPVANLSGESDSQRQARCDQRP